MHRSIIAGLVGIILSASAACAACPTSPLVNGTTADASLLSAYITGCFGPLDSPNFTTNLAVNSVSPSHLFDVNFGGTFSSSNASLAYIGGTFATTSTSSIVYGLNFVPTYTATSGPTNIVGELVKPQISSSNGATHFTALRGIWITPVLLSGYTGTIGTVYGVETADINPSSSQNVSVFQSFRADGASNGSGITTGTVTNYDFYAENATAGANTGGTVVNYGVYAVVGTGSGTGTTTNYGVRITGAGGAGGGGTTKNYALYSDSSAANYFAGNVGIGTTTPAQALEVNGQVKIDALASASGTNLCINGSVVASCSSSIRYKENVKDASFGLKDIEQMRPVTFKWKGRDENDFGLIAEEIAKINPLFVTYKDGKIEGVKYPQLTAVLIGGIKELEVKNEAQAAVVDQLKRQLAAQKQAAAAVQDNLDQLRRETAGLRSAIEQLRLANKGSGSKQPRRTALR